MRKLINALVVCFALFTVFSCTNPDIEIKKIVTVEVNPSGVIGAFKPYDQSDFDFFSISGKKTQLHIKALQYNAEGDLIKEYDGTLSSYDNKLQIPVEVSDNCKLLCFSYLSTDKDFETHTIKGKEKLNTLNVVQDFMLGPSLLGYANVALSLSDSKMTVNLESLSALIYLEYRDIHAKDAQGVDEYKMWLQMNDIAKYNGGSFTFDSSLSSVEYYTDDIDPSDYSGKNVYGYYTCLPGTFDTFASLGIGSNRLDSNNLKMSVQSGHQYVLELNCNTMELHSYEGPLNTKTNTEWAAYKK